MIRNEPTAKRELAKQDLSCDLAVVGGGLAGLCCAVTAARAGLKVVLIQDRPVLGGNASSEVRLWILGATSHMGNNNRWAREGGVIDEILVENLYRNPEGNPLIVDTILLEKVVSEPNITLLLNTAVFELEKSDPNTIRSVHAFCSQNSTRYEVTAPLFCDASGDGIVGFLAGAAFRMGSESREEFGEGLAPAQSSQDLLGHTLYFYSKDTGRPVRFVPPAFALRDIARIPRWRDIKAGDYGCRFWWFEWGGKMDTVHDAEKIKWELWRVVYGVWDYIKNSGIFPEAETYTLEWVGTIPGKRESRRFEGDYILKQQDIVEQRRHPDAVSYGGWAIDLHPAEGVYSPLPGCAQWHSKGVYQIPFRTMYSRNIGNLFLAGRIISASHVAFGSTRVMATCAHGGQAAGMAAVLCARDGLRPRDLLEPARMKQLQRALLRAGQFIPGLPLMEATDLAQAASITASSELELDALEDNGETLLLDQAAAMMLPLRAGPVPRVQVTVDAAEKTTLRAELRISGRPGNHTPDVTLGVLEIPLAPGQAQPVTLDFNRQMEMPGYAFVCLMGNASIRAHLSDQRVTGVLMVRHSGNKAVAKGSEQNPPPGSGLEAFEFWIPVRRPQGKNFAMRIDPPIQAFAIGNLKNGFSRPTAQPNAWVAAFDDEKPVIRLKWPTPQRVSQIELCFDPDFDHPVESVLMGHPERMMPFCVREVAVACAAPAPVIAGARDGGDTDLGESEAVEPGSTRALFRITENHQSRQVIRLEEPVTTDEIELRLAAPSSTVPAALFDVRCYA